MKVKLKIDTPGGSGMLRAGTIIDVSESEAMLLVGNDLAEKETVREKAPRKPRAKRSR